MSDFENYISLLKKKINYDFKSVLKTKISFFLRHYDDMGFLINNKDIINEFFDIIRLFIIERNYDKDLLKLLDSEDVLKIFPFGKRIFIKKFYETFAFNTSTMVIKNILYETLSKIIYFIYFFSVSLLSFEEYFNYNNVLVCEDKERIKIISDYILYEDDVFYDSDHITSTSFKLLSLGHLLKKDFNIEVDDEDNDSNTVITNGVTPISPEKEEDPKKYGEGFIMESKEFAYARISLEITKNLSNSFLIQVYKDIKKGYYSPSTPMFYHSLTKYNLLSSCFLLNVEDNTESIGELLKKITKIQKFNSGIGINFSKIRSMGRPVLDGMAKSNGIEPFISILGTLSAHFRNTKRERSANINTCISIDHPDVFNMINMKMSNVKKEDKNLKNVFTTISIPDEFMYRYLKKEDWYLISPDQHIDNVHLYDVYGEEYSKLYNKMLESPEIEKKKVDIADLFSSIVNSLIQTGGPFLFFKDCVNYTSNHKHYGVIQGTNLCTEIFEYYDDEETACCNLVSFNLKKFINEEKKFDFKLFEEKINNVVCILNNTIDVGIYSHPTCEKANLDKRPLGIGIQGLANMFGKMGIPFIKGMGVYKEISESLYYFALKASNNLAKENKFKKYDTENKSNLKQGKFSFDLFKDYQMNKKRILKTIPKIDTEADKICEKDFESSFEKNNEHGINWEELKKNIQEHGVVNSLLIAYMPTSLSSGINNNVEGFEPYSYNILRRDFSLFGITCYNESLVEYLLKNKYYTPENIIKELKDVEGDFMKLKNVPIKERKKYKLQYQTIYNMKTKDYVKFISCNNHLVDQGKSTNIYVPGNDNFEILKTIIHLWIYGAKSTYYYRPEIKINPKVLSDFKKESVKICLPCSS